MTGNSNLKFDILPTLMEYHLCCTQISFFEISMSEVQITPGQFGVITLIPANPGLTQLAFAHAVGIERSTMVTVIDIIESRNLVKGRSSLADERSYSLVFSAEGSDMLEQFKPMVLEREKK